MAKQLRNPKKNFTSFISCFLKFRPHLDLLVKNKQNVDLPDSLPSIYAYECAPKEIVQIVNSEFFTTYYHQLEEIISQYDKNELPGSNPAFISSNNSTRMYSNHPNITSYTDTNTSPTDG